MGVTVDSGRGEFTCDDVTVHRVSCTQVAIDGAAKYCENLADHLVHGSSTFSILRKYQCRRFCEAAAASCNAVGTGAAKAMGKTTNPWG